MTPSISNVDKLVQQFEQDGFVKVEPLLDEPFLQKVELQLSLYLREIAPGLPDTDIVYESGQLPAGERAIRNLWRMEKQSQFFSDLSMRPEILELVRRLIHGNPIVSGVELFAKPARVGSAVPFHQDNAYFNLTPPDALTCWIALDDSDASNGCVYYAPGTHRNGLSPHVASHVKGNSLKMANPPVRLERSEIPGILKRGGAIFHHCVLMHRSEPNRSDRPRRGLLIVYRGSHCRQDPEQVEEYRKVLAAGAKLPA